MSGELILSYDDGAKHNDVAVAGEFTGWNPSHMQIESGTKWTAKFTSSIHAGHDYMYKFVVDGEWKLLEGHTTRTDLEGNVNHLATATIIQSGGTPAAAATPGVVPVTIHKPDIPEGATLADIKEHDRQRAAFLAKQLETAEKRDVSKQEQTAKVEANLGSVGHNAPASSSKVQAEFDKVPVTPKSAHPKENENSSTKDIYEESDIPPATDPDSTIGSAYTPDKSWSSPARGNAEVVGPSGVSTPPRGSRKDEGSISSVSAPTSPATPTNKVPPTKATPTKGTAPAAAAAAKTALKTDSTGAAATGTPAATTAAKEPASAGSAAANTSVGSKDATDKKEKPAKQRSSLRKFFRKLME